MTDAMIRPGNPQWDRLFQLWLKERKASTIMLGDTTYQVFTPNGEEEPIFKQQGYQELYVSTSGGLHG